MKKILLFLVSILLFLLCGCTGYREIDRGYLVTAIGISQENQKTNIFIEAISSSDVADKPSERVVLTGNGDSIDAAFKKLNSSLVKPLYFEQLGTAVFDDALSDKVYMDFLNFLKRLEGINLGICAVKTNNVKKLFELESPNGVLGYDIMGLIKMYEKETRIKVVNKLYQLEHNKNPLPTLKLDEDKFILDYQGD